MAIGDRKATTTRPIQVGQKQAFRIRHKGSSVGSLRRPEDSRSPDRVFLFMQPTMRRVTRRNRTPSSKFPRIPPFGRESWGNFGELAPLRQ